MLDKTLQIRVDNEFLEDLELLCKIRGYRNKSEALKEIVYKELRESRMNSPLFRTEIKQLNEMKDECFRHGDMRGYEVITDVLGIFSCNN